MSGLKLKKHSLIIICILLVLCIPGAYFARIISKVYASRNVVNTYIEKNHADINMDNSITTNDFSILDSDFTRNTVILTGEEHAVGANYKLKLALIKYLNKKYDVNYILDEIGYSSSCFINQYLETGDEEKLKLVYRNLQGTAFGNKDDYNFWIQLRKYDMTLPESSRVKVVGIDIEHQLSTACEYLKYLLPDKYPPEQIEGAVERFKNYYISIYTDEFSKTMEYLQNDIKANPLTYSRYLGDNYFDFRLVVNNIINSINAYSAHDSSFYSIREPIMYENFLMIYYHLPYGKYFGELGMDHVYQKINSSSYLGNTESFANYLDTDCDSPAKGKVLSIAYGYEDCFYTNCANNYRQNKCISIINNFDMINKYSNTDMTVFKLNGKDSPFSKSLYFFKCPEGGSTTNYFQYLILIKNSKGSTPLWFLN